MVLHSFTHPVRSPSQLYEFLVPVLQNEVPELVSERTKGWVSSMCPHSLLLNLTAHTENQTIARPQHTAAVSSATTFPVLPSASAYRQG